MTELGEYQLHRTPGMGGSGPERWRIVVIVVALVLVGAMVVFFVMRRWSSEQRPPVTGETVESPAADEPVTATEERVEESDAIDLPVLDESDALVRELIGALSAHPAFVAWMATDDLVRMFVVVVDNMAEGDTPARHLQMLAPRDPFLVAGGPSRPVIDPRGYARYDLLADAFDSLDVDGCARLYAQLAPLMTEAYRELGHPEGHFEAALVQAIDQVLGTPIVDREIALVSDAVAYEFADESLESLSGVQRQALRMGPRNLRLVHRKLGELATALGLPTPAAADPP